MKIMLSDDRLQFREKVCKKHLAGAAHVTVNVTWPVSVLAALSGASHG